TPELSRRAVQDILAGGEFGRPLVVTPGTPPERLNILREAFAKSMKEPELLVGSKKSKMDLVTSTGEELEALIKEAMSQRKEVNERVRNFCEINAIEPCLKIRFYLYSPSINPERSNSSIKRVSMKPRG